MAHSIGVQVHRYRNERQPKMSAQQLADECSRLGAPIPRGVIAKIESGSRAFVTVDELLVLAAALGVPPLRLLVPLDSQDVELLPGRPTNVWAAVSEFTGDAADEMELFREYRQEEHALRSLLRAATNRGGWLQDVPDLRMARGAYERLLAVRHKMSDRGLAEPELPRDLQELLAKPGFTDATRS